MESTFIEPAELISKIDQKAVRLSAMLRDIDNHPVEIEAELAEGLESILEMLECRIAATRALLREKHPAGAKTAG